MVGFPLRTISGGAEDPENEPQRETTLRRWGWHDYRLFCTPILSVPLTAVFGCQPTADADHKFALIVALANQIGLIPRRRPALTGICFSSDATLRCLQIPEDVTDAGIVFG